MNDKTLLMSKLRRTTNSFRKMSLFSAREQTSKQVYTNISHIFYYNK